MEGLSEGVISKLPQFADASPRQTEDSKNQDVFPIGDTPGLPGLPGLPGIGDTLLQRSSKPRLLGVPSAKCHSALPGGMFLRRNRTPSSVASTQDLPSEDDMNTPEVPGPVPIDSTWPHQKDPKGLHRWWSLESGGTWRRWRVWRSRGSRSRWRWSRIRRRGLFQCLQMCIALSNHRVCRWFWSIMFIADCSAVFYTWVSLGICNFLGTSWHFQKWD